MRKLTLFTVVAAVLVAGWVRVQLVAVAQEQPGGTSAAAAPTSEKAETPPAGPPTKVARELLTYDGKRFEDFEAILASELAPDRRAEAIKALTAFAPAGYAEEVAAIIFTEVESFDQLRYEGSQNELLRTTCMMGFVRVDPKFVTPLLVKAIREGSYGGRRIAISAVRKRNQSPELTEALLAVLADGAQDSETRLAALPALRLLEPPMDALYGRIRDIVLGDAGSPELREEAMQTFRFDPEAADDWKQRYAREFAVPIQIARIDRDGLRDGDFFAFQFAPELAFPRVAEWLAKPESPLDTFAIESILRPKEAAIAYFAPRLEEADDSAKLRTLEVLQMLTLSDIDRTIAKDAPVVAAWEGALPAIVAAADSPNQAVAQAANNLLKTFAWGHEFRLTPLQAASDAELTKRGVENTPEQLTMFRSQRDRYERSQQQDRMRRAFQNNRGQQGGVSGAGRRASPDLGQ